MTIENSFILVIAVQWLSIITVLYWILRKLDNLIVLFAAQREVNSYFVKKFLEKTSDMENKNE